MESLKTVYVSGKGDGDFNCDGKYDHIEINKAFKFVHDNPEYNTVYLKGDFTFTVGQQLKIYDNTIFAGDKSAVLKLCDNCTLAKDVAIITQANASKTNPGTIVIRGFEYNGNSDGNKSIPTGKSYFTFAWIFYSKVLVEDMYMHHTNNDCIKVKYSNSVIFRNNKIYKMGHEALYAIECNNIQYYGNNVWQRTNSAVRLQNSNHAKVYNNEIYTEFTGDAGGPGIQIQYTDSPFPMDDIEVFNNNVHDTYGPGMWIITTGGAYDKTDACNVYVHDNTFKGCGTHSTYNWLGGIVTSGFYDLRIENNIFDGCYGYGIVWMYPADARFSGLAPKGTSKPYKMIVKGNTICNTQKRKGSTSGGVASDASKTGQGIANYYPDIASVESNYNKIYDNAGGAYLNVTSTTDIGKEEEIVKFYGNRLKESSPTAIIRNPDFYDVGALNGKRYRWLMWADLSDAGQFEKAILVLDWYFPSTARAKDTEIQVFRAKPFDTLTATWATSAEGFTGDVVGSFTVPASAKPTGRIEIDITSLVKEYIATGVNDGFMIKAATEGDNYIAFSGIPDIEYTAVPESEYVALPCEKCGENAWNREKKTDGTSSRINCLKCGNAVIF